MARSNNSIDYVLFSVFSILVLFGLVVLTSASAPVGYDQFQDSYYFIKHQLVFGLVPGIAGMVLTTFMPYTFWKKYALHFLIFTLALLVAVFIPGLSANIGTANSWISVGGLFSLQPSEIIKLTFLFYLAAWLAGKDKEEIRDLNSGLIPFVGVLGLVLGLLILQPDVGTMSIIAAMSLVVYFVAKAPLLYIGGLLMGGVASLAVLIGVEPYRAARFTTFLNPELAPKGIGYHINQALLAIGSGGFFGVGYGRSRQKFQFLPEVTSDSVFAVLAEEMGFLVSTLTILIFLALIWRMVYIAYRAPDNFAKYVTVGVAAWIGVQAFVNIGSMVGVLPMTGVPLPFISYGGTSLAVSMTAIGVVLNISKHVTTTRKSW